MKETTADFAVATLCGLLRAAFGMEATEEALRRVAACRRIAQRDIADTWTDVLQDLKRTP